MNAINPREDLKAKFGVRHQIRHGDGDDQDTKFSGKVKDTKFSGKVKK